MDLSVQEEGVSSKKSSGQSKDNGESSCCRSAQGDARSTGDLAGGLLQVGEDVVDVFTSTGVSIEVVPKDLAQLGFALGSSFVSVRANFGNFGVLVLVVVTVVVVLAVVVVVVGVLIDLKTRDAVVDLNNRFLFVRKRVSIVESLVDTRSGVRNATSILEGSQVDALSVPRRTHGTNVVWAGHVNTVVVAVTVVVTAVVVVVVSVSTLHGFIAVRKRRRPKKIPFRESHRQSKNNLIKLAYKIRLEPHTHLGTP